MAETVPGTFAIRLQLLLTFFFTDKLLSEIAIAVTAGNAKIRRLQFLHHLSDGAQLERASGNMHWRLGRVRIRRYKRLPGAAYE